VGGLTTAYSDGQTLVRSVDAWIAADGRYGVTPLRETLMISFSQTSWSCPTSPHVVGVLDQH